MLFNAKRLYTECGANITQKGTKTKVRISFKNKNFKITSKASITS